MVIGRNNPNDCNTVEIYPNESRRSKAIWLRVRGQVGELHDNVWATSIELSQGEARELVRHIEKLLHS